MCLRGQGSKRHEGARDGAVRIRLADLSSDCEDGPLIVNQCFTHDSLGAGEQRAVRKSKVLHQPPAANKHVMKYIFNTHVHKTTQTHTHLGLIVHTAKKSNLNMFI